MKLTFGMSYRSPTATSSKIYKDIRRFFSLKSGEIFVIYKE